jgi:hypothetical protein
MPASSSAIEARVHKIADIDEGTADVVLKFPRLNRMYRMVLSAVLLPQ